MSVCVCVCVCVCYSEDLRHAVTAPLSSVLDENTAVAVHTAFDIDPGDPVNMSFLLALELTQSRPQSFWLNEGALKNIESMSVTLDTSHLERSPLKDDAERNM